MWEACSNTAIQLLKNFETFHAWTFLKNVTFDHPLIISSDTNKYFADYTRISWGLQNSRKLSRKICPRQLFFNFFFAELMFCKSLFLIGVSHTISRVIQCRSECLATFSLKTAVKFHHVAVFSKEMTFQSVLSMFFD